MFILPYILLSLVSTAIYKSENFPGNHTRENSRIVYLAPETKMYITGSTNFKSFKCNCSTADNAIPLSMTLRNQKLYFNNTRLNINARKMNCNQKIYNSNIRKSLEAEQYPNISIDLEEAWKVNDYFSVSESAWFEVMAITNLTIKQTTKNYTVRGKAIKISDSKYRIIGSQIVSMKDFKICTPEILFGLITVNDKIEFTFDLAIEIVK